MGTPVVTPDALLDGGIFASEERRRALVAAATPARSGRGRQPDFGRSSRSRRERSPFREMNLSERRSSRRSRRSSTDPLVIEWTTSS
jgi:hypothetical protein